MKYHPVADAAENAQACSAPSPDSDTELLARLEIRDPVALALLFERHRESLLIYIRCRMGRELSARATAEELYQETVFAALHGLAHFEVRSSAQFEGWIRTIARNCVYTRARSGQAQRRPRHDAPLPEFLHAFTAPEGLEHPEKDDDEREAVPREELVRMARDLQLMRADDRTVIVLRGLVGASWKTLAFLLRRPTDEAARLLHNRAGRRLSLSV